ncbi:MAG TPA: hypothetical protein VJI67_00245 [archaeon]|nr:hypothetical protein [archaeon]HLD81000.1 hypothetical protein [archaeon]
MTDVPESVPEEVQAQEEAEDNLPFARAEIYRLLRKSVGDSKIIRSSVKEEMNVFLGRIGEKIGSKLAQTKYTSVELADLLRAIEPYEHIDDLHEERLRIVSALERIKMDCDSLVRDVNRKFGVVEEATIAGARHTTEDKKNP